MFICFANKASIDISNIMFDVTRLDLTIFKKMSKVDAQLAKLYGFSPKYLWDQFESSHYDLAKKVKVQTYPLIMEIEETQQAITTVSKKILIDNGFNLQIFLMKGKDARKVENDNMRLYRLKREHQSNEEDTENKRLQVDLTVSEIDAGSSDDEENEDSGEEASSTSNQFQLSQDVLDNMRAFGLVVSDEEDANIANQTCDESMCQALMTGYVKWKGIAKDLQARVQVLEDEIRQKDKRIQDLVDCLESEIDQ